MNTKPYVALFTVQASFAAFGVVAKYVLEAGLSPITLAGLRAFFAALVLAAIALPMAPKTISMKDLGKLAGLSVLGVILNQLAFLQGLSMTTAIDATLLVAMIPVFTLLLSILFRREHFDPPRALGVAIALSGALVLLHIEKFGAGGSAVIGNLLVVANCLSYSFYLVLGRGILQRMPSPFVIGTAFVIGALVMTPLAMPGFVEVTSNGGLPTKAWIAFAIVIGLTVLAYALNTYALKRLRASTVATFTFLQPVLAALLAIPLLGERLTTRSIVAGALIVAGVLVVARHEAARRSKALRTAAKSQPGAGAQP